MDSNQPVGVMRSAAIALLGFPLAWLWLGSLELLATMLTDDDSPERE